MLLSTRLNMIAKMVDKCDKIADIGTDHAFIPIYLLQNNICNSAIASDINDGPLIKAKSNISIYNMMNRIECRLGGGLSVLKPGEVDSAIIAGMGGYLIRDILNDDKEIVKGLKTLILQPVQNVEIVREYLYTNGYSVLDEDMCYDEGKFYEVIKASYGLCEVNPGDNTDTGNNIYYEVSKLLLEKKHPLMKDFIEYKINKYTIIKNNISANSLNARNRLEEVEQKIISLKELVL